MCLRSTANSAQKTVRVSTEKVQWTPGLVFVGPGVMLPRSLGDQLFLCLDRCDPPAGLVFVGSGVMLPRSLGDQLFLCLDRCDTQVVVGDSNPDAIAFRNCFGNQQVGDLIVQLPLNYPTHWAGTVGRLIAGLSNPV